MQHTKPRRVDFANLEDDFEVAMLGSLGKSTKFIAKYTGLSPCQVTYRLSRGRIKRRDYRDGTSGVSKEILNVIMPRIDPIVRRHLSI